MVAQLIWIAAVYASAVALIHVLHIRENTWRMSRSGKWIHYIFITRNHEAVVEWYIRALAFHAFLTGRKLRVTFMDDESSDATLEIVSRMLQSGCSIDLADPLHHVPVEEEWKQQGIVVDLRLSGQPIPLPLIRTAGSRGYGSKHGGM